MHLPPQARALLHGLRRERVDHFSHANSTWASASLASSAARACAALRMLQHSRVPGIQLLDLLLAQPFPVGLLDLGDLLLTGLRRASYAFFAAS